MDTPSKRLPIPTGSYKTPMQVALKVAEVSYPVKKLKTRVKDISLQIARKHKLIDEIVERLYSLERKDYERAKKKIACLELDISLLEDKRQRVLIKLELKNKAIVTTTAGFFYHG